MNWQDLPSCGSISFMIVREENFEVVEKYTDFTKEEKEALGFTNEDIFWTDAEMLNVDDFCFYCSKPLTLPCCMWSGYTKEIYLHTECVHSLAKGLLRDVREIEDGK